MSNCSKILIVDEDLKIQSMTREILERNGFSVGLASDAISAVLEAKRQRPDLVLLNIDLPGGGGMSVLSRFDSLTPLKVIPVLIFSDEDPSIHLKNVLQAGAKDFISKHADEAELIEAIRRLLPPS